MPSASSRNVLTLLFVALGVLLTLPFAWQFNAGLDDEAVVLDAARRMLAGQVPYRDFDMFYTPASMALATAWFKLVGFSMTTARVFMLLVGGALAAALFRLSDRLLPRRLALAPPLMFLISGYSEWPLVSYHWVAILFFLIALACLTEKADLWAGVAVGLAGASLQTEGVAGFVTALVIIGLRRDWKGFLRFLAGLAIVWVPLVVYLAATGAGPSFVENTILRALKGLYKSHGAPYDPVRHVWEPWQGIASQWPSSWGIAQLAWAVESVLMVSLWSFKYLLLFPVLLAGAVVAWRRGSEARVLAVALLLWTLLKRERLDLLYSNYLMALWYLALAVLLHALWGRSRRLAALVGVFVAGLYTSALILTLMDAGRFQYPVRAAAGTLYSRHPQQAAAMQALYEATARLTPPERETFAWPFAASLYSMTLTRNPTRLDFMVPGWQDLEQASAVATTLGQRQVSVIYYFPLDEGIFRDYPALDPERFQKEMTAVNAVITESYEPYARAGSAIIYRRKE